MATLLKYLRDPAWQAIGVLLAVIAIFMSTSTSIKGDAELSIVHVRKVRFSEYWLPTDRVKLMIEGLSQDVENAEVDYFILINSSRTPIVPADITSPIEVSEGPGSKRLILVESCSKRMAQACSPDESSGGAGGTYVAFDWYASKNKWNARPGLLNPGDQSCVLLISERAAGQPEGMKERFAWGGRIVNVRLRVYASFNEYQQRIAGRWIDYWRAVVLMHGIGVYWFILLQTVLFVVFAYLAIRARWMSAVPISHVFRISLVAFLSITSAEILVDIFVNRQQYLHPVVWPLLIAHVTFGGFLVFRILQHK